MPQPSLDKRTDDKLQNLILERLSAIEIKVDKTHEFQESLNKTCLTRSFEIEKINNSITDHIGWHDKKKRKADRLKEAMLLSMFGTMLFLARDKISTIINIIFKGSP